MKHADDCWERLERVAADGVVPVCAGCRPSPRASKRRFEGWRERQMAKPGYREAYEEALAEITEQIRFEARDGAT